MTRDRIASKETICDVKIVENKKRERKHKGYVVQPNNLHSQRKALDGYIFTMQLLVLQ